MRKKWRKSSFCPAISGSNYRANENKIKDTILEFCRVQPIIIKDKVLKSKNLIETQKSGNVQYKGAS